MYCESFACHMSTRACKANIGLALHAIVAINEEGQSLFTLSEQEINRMIVCGHCPESGMREEAKRAFRSSLDDILEKAERYGAWDEPKPDRADAKAKYREEHREEIREAREEARIDQRIEQLTRSIGGNDDDTHRREEDPHQGHEASGKGQGHDS